MKQKLLSLLLAAVLLCAFAGCQTVSDIAGNVADAAKQELEQQIKATLEKNKVEVIELKTAAGKLNGNGGELQFYCAALVRSESDALPAACADAMGKVFEEAGIMTQTGSQITDSHLVHKTLQYDRTDFSGGGYYTVYVYISDISIDLPEFTLPEITLPALG